jgi:6-phosphogluconolactonase (cycloisomerase 2 family)
MNRRSWLSYLGSAIVAGATMFALPADARRDTDRDDAVGAVYTMTNAAGGNEIVVFDRDERGRLTKVAAVPTGGNGSGGGLDPLASQGSLVLSANQRWLLAVNAGSNEISVLRVGSRGLELVDVVDSGGVFPTSIALFQNLVYVLNAGGTANVAGFRIDHRGRLSAIAGSTRVLPGGLHSQVGFDPRGEVLVVTDRATSSLLVYPIDDDGSPAGGPVASPSHGPGPFSFVFTRQGTLLVAEVGTNAVSSYALEDDGSLRVISGSVANGQAATCWIATAKNRYAFTANPGTSSLSSYRQHPGSGEVRLLAGVAASGSRPLDLAASIDDRFLYALDPGASGVAAFEVRHDGTLHNLGPVPGGLPLFAQGLAVR